MGWHDATIETKENHNSLNSYIRKKHCDEELELVVIIYATKNNNIFLGFWRGGGGGGKEKQPKKSNKIKIKEKHGRRR